MMKPTHKFVWGNNPKRATLKNRLCRIIANGVKGVRQSAGVEENTMKALSVKQPWAWAILHGKPVENRTWYTGYRGPILIHAGKKFDLGGYVWLTGKQNLLTTELPLKSQFQMGGIVGRSRIVGCVDDHPSAFFFGPWGFVLEDSQPIDSIPYRGQLGIFEIPDNLIK